MLSDFQVTTQYFKNLRTW